MKKLKRLIFYNQSRETIPVSPNYMYMYMYMYMQAG